MNTSTKRIMDKEIATYTYHRHQYYRAWTLWGCLELWGCWLCNGTWEKRVGGTRLKRI